MGARAGDLTRVELPNGRVRALEVRYEDTPKAA